ncbi:hypothetical protein G9A89_004556 [Geosiphon pyriformis]|nr:hypothetical protein G9A89_004556 [Geosiphon pyriformis]
MSSLFSKFFYGSSQIVSTLNDIDNINGVNTSEPSKVHSKTDITATSAEDKRDVLQLRLPAPQVPRMTISDTQEQDIPGEFPSVNGPQRVKKIVSSSSALTSTSTKATPLQKANKMRQKVTLQPGHSPRDWGNLKNSGADLRGVCDFRKYTLEELRQHKTENDAWTALNGTIYNITPYLKFHPGGEKELMRCAGRDGTKLFMATHGWVNYDIMLDKCAVGILISDTRTSEVLPVTNKKYKIEQYRKGCLNYY